MIKAHLALFLGLLWLATAACADRPVLRQARRLAAIDITCTSTLATALSKCGEGQPTADSPCCQAFTSKAMTDCLPALTSEFAAASSNPATADTAAQFFTAMAACGRNATAGGSDPPPASLDLGEGLDNFTTGPLPDVSVLVNLRLDKNGIRAHCTTFNGTTRKHTVDWSTYFGASGSAMPPESDIKALADVMCAMSAEGAAEQLLEEVTAGGASARVAVAAFFSPSYPCTKPLTETSPNTLPPAHQALALQPVMTDPRTVMKYAVAIVRAADEIGLPLCITVAVAEQPPLTQVLAVEQVHTGKRLGVWPSPSGETLPIGLLGTSMHMDEIDPIICKTFNGTGWEEDPSNGPHGSSGTDDPPKKELKAFSDIVCKQSVKTAAKALAEAIAKGGKEAQAALGAVFLSDGPNCPNGTSVFDATTPVWDAFRDLPELNSPTTIMRYVPNMVTALDSIGVSTCIAVAVVDPDAKVKEVYFQEYFHTNGTDAAAE